MIALLYIKECYSHFSMLARISAVKSSPDSVAATTLSRAGETSKAEMPPKLRPPRVSANFWFPDEEIL